MSNFIVKVGAIQIPVYHGESGKYQSWTAAATVNGKQVRKNRSTREGAERAAKEMAESIMQGAAFQTTLDAADSASFFRSMEIIKETKVPLETVCAEWLQIRQEAGGRSAVELVRIGAKLNPIGERKEVRTVINELIAAKVADGMSRKYIKDVSLRLDRFAGYFKGDLMGVTGQAIDKWLRDLKCGEELLAPRSRNNYRRVIHTFFNFAIAKRYLPKDWAVMDEIGTAKLGPSVIDIFTPPEIAKLLAHAPKNLKPFLAIGAFAGVRHEEIMRMKWENILWRSGHIVVNAESAKTGMRRLVPLANNLKAWLKTNKNNLGPVCTIGNVSRSLLEVSARAGVPWKHNALRHSYISYRVAETQDVAKVALEAGNSPRMIFTNYRELVTPEQGQKWFKIRPVLS